MKVFYKCAVALLFTGVTIFNANAQRPNVYWTGAVSERWEDPANWVIGDTIDPADEMQGFYIDSLSLWIKSYDPTLGWIWFTGSDGETQYGTDVETHIPATPNKAVADTASHLIYNNLDNPPWSRPYHMYIDSGATAEVAVPFAQDGNGKATFYVNKDVHVNGTLLLRDTAFIGSRNQTYVGTGADGGELIIESGSEYNVKVITRMGAHIVEVDTIEGVPVETHTDRIGKVYVRGGSFYPGGNYGLSWGNWGDGFDVSRANGSCVVIDSGIVSSLIRDLSNLQGTLENPLIIINGGEFQSLDDMATWDLIQLFGQNVVAAGNGGELVFEQMDGYVSITNSNPVTAVEKVKDLEVNVYPNPAQGGNFTVEVPANEQVNVTVYNAVGQKVYTSTYNDQGAIQVNANLKKGMYVVEIASQNSNSFNTTKLIVQ